MQQRASCSLHCASLPQKIRTTWQITTILSVHLYLRIETSSTIAVSELNTDLLRIIESENSDPNLLCIALNCFPAISHSKADRAKVTGGFVAALTLNGQHSVSVSASGALHRYAIRNPETSLVL